MEFYSKTIKHYIEKIYVKIFKIIFNRFPEHEYLKLIQNNAPYVLQIPDYLKNTKFYIKAAKANGLVLEHIPIAYQTEALCINAVQSDGNALKFVQNQTVKICLEAVKNYAPSLKYVKNKTIHICETAIKGLFAESILQYVPENFKTYEICFKAVKRSGNNLEYVPEHLKDYELCKESVRCYSKAYPHIPVQFRTEELNLIAIKNNYRVMKYIDYKTPEFCLKALQINKDTLNYIDIAPNNNLKETTEYLQNLIAKKKYIIDNL